MALTHRKAVQSDLKIIVQLLQQDELGRVRENASSELDQRYVEAFAAINNDPNQYLMVVEQGNQVIGTCHLTLLPSLTFTGSLRLQIEAVRVDPSCRGKGVGQWMIEQAVAYGRAHNAKIIQLTTNTQRVDAIRFYESLGFQSTHEGMKLYL